MEDFRTLGAKQHLTSNLIWATLGKGITLIGSLFVGIVVARYLGPERYGLMNYVVSYVTLFQVLAYFGLDNIEIREESKNPEDFRRIVGTALGLRSVLAGITLIAVAIVSLLLESDHETLLYIFIYSLTIVANSFIVYRNYFIAIVQNEHVAKSEISRTVLGITIKIILLLLNAHLVWFIIAITFDIFILAGGYQVAFFQKTGKRFSLTYDKSYAKYLLKESFPLLFTSVAVIIYQRIDQVMIGKMINNEAVGYFSVANRIVDILIYVPQIAIQAFVPVLIRKLKESKDIFLKEMQVFMNVTFWGTFITSAFVAMLSWIIVPLLFGDIYNPAIPILQLLSFKAACAALSSVAGQMLIIEGLQSKAIFRDLMGCFVCVVLNFILIPHFGIMAAACVALLSSLVSGYISDAIIPVYRHIFKMQTKTLLAGYQDIRHINKIFKR